MKEIVGVRFKSVGKIYYFSPGDLRLTVGDRVIVETVKGRFPHMRGEDSFQKAENEPC